MTQYGWNHAVLFVFILICSTCGWGQTAAHLSDVRQPLDLPSYLTSTAYTQIKPQFEAPGREDRRQMKARELLTRWLEFQRNWRTTDSLASLHLNCMGVALAIVSGEVGIAGSWAIRCDAKAKGMKRLASYLLGFARMAREFPSNPRLRRVDVAVSIAPGNAKSPKIRWRVEPLTNSAVADRTKHRTRRRTRRRRKKAPASTIPWISPVYTAGEKSHLYLPLGRWRLTLVDAEGHSIDKNHGPYKAPQFKVLDVRSGDTTVTTNAATVSKEQYGARAVAPESDGSVSGSQHVPLEEALKLTFALKLWRQKPPPSAVPSTNTIKEPPLAVPDRPDSGKSEKVGGPSPSHATSDTLEPGALANQRANAHTPKSTERAVVSGVGGLSFVGFGVAYLMSNSPAPEYHRELSKEPATADAQRNLLLGGEGFGRQLWTVHSTYYGLGSGFGAALGSGVGPRKALARSAAFCVGTGLRLVTLGVAAHWSLKVAQSPLGERRSGEASYALVARGAAGLAGGLSSASSAWRQRSTESRIGSWALQGLAEVGVVYGLHLAHGANVDLGQERSASMSRPMWVTTGQTGVSQRSLGLALAGAGLGMSIMDGILPGLSSQRDGRVSIVATGLGCIVGLGASYGAYSSAASHIESTAPNASKATNSGNVSAVFALLGGSSCGAFLADLKHKMLN